MQSDPLGRLHLKAHVAVLAALLTGASCVTVPAGHAALVTGLSGVEGPLGEGVHVVDPFAAVELLDLRRQEKNDDLFAVTRDGAAIEAGTSLVTYRLAPDELLPLMRGVGPEPYAVAIGPVVSATTRRVLGQLRLDELDTPHLRWAQDEITRSAAVELRPLHLILESVDLRQVRPLSELVRRGFEAAAVLEQEVAAAPDHLRLATQEATRRRSQAEGIAAAHAVVAPTLTSSSLEEQRTHALDELVKSKNASVTTDGAFVLEVTP